MYRRATYREKVIFSICLFFVAVYVIYMWTKSHTSENAGKEDSLNSAIIQMKKNVKSVQDIGKIRNEYAQWEKKYIQQGRDEETQSNLMMQIQKIATDLNLKIADVKPQKIQTEKFFKRYTVSLALDATLPEIVDFMQMLQQPPHQFKMQELRLDKSGNRSEENTIHVYMVISKFFIVANGNK